MRFRYHTVTGFGAIPFITIMALKVDLNSNKG